MSAKTRTFTLSDGRFIAWCEYGNPASTSPPIFYFHGLPSSRYEGALWHTQALEHDVRLISPDRPGIGQSSYDPNRSVISSPADILELASHLQIKQFRVLGYGRGGAYALACLRVTDPSVCKGGQIVSSVYPPKLGTKGMSIERKAIKFLGHWTPGVLAWGIDKFLGAAARDPDTTVLEKSYKNSYSTLPERDQEAIEKEDFAPVMVEAIRECFKGEHAGFVLEGHLTTVDWGFGLEDIDLKGRDVTMWHGKLDLACPIETFEKAAALLDGVETKILEEENHYLIAHHRGAIISNFLRISKGA